MVIAHNLIAMNTNRQMGVVTDRKAKSTEKLSSGYRVNRAADDAAGLSISEKMRYQIKGLDQASTNAMDGISTVQTAEGALNEVHSILHRMNELATQAANDTNTSADRNQIAKELDQLVSEIDRISSSTQFNTMNLLDGTFTGKNLQVGSLCGQAIEISIDSMTASSLSLIFPGGVPAEAVSSNPALSVSISDESKVTDTTLRFSSFYPVTHHDATVIPGGNVSITSAGQSYFTGSATDRYVFYMEAGTTYGSAPVKTISQSGMYEFKKGNGDEVMDASDLSNAVTVSPNLHPTYLTYASTPADRSSVRIQDARDVTATTPVTTWTENGRTAANPGNYGISVSGSPAVGDSISLSAASTGKLEVDTFAHAGKSMQRIQGAIDKVSTQRSKLGAIQNRLEHTISNIDQTSENTSAAESRIRDTEMAGEMVAFSRDSILMQASEAMLSQANQISSSVLSLLQ